MDIKIYEKLEQLDRQKYNFEKNRCMVGWIGKKNMKKIDVWLDGFHIHTYLLYITYPFIIHN